MRFDVPLKKPAQGVAGYPRREEASARSLRKRLMLQSVHEHSQLLTRDVAAVAPASTGYAIGSLGTLAPWQSPAVLELRQGVGKREGAAPMMIEGRYGTALAAIGEPRDHKVAGRALGQAMTVQLQPTVKAGALGGPAARRGGALASAGGGCLAVSNAKRHGASFGAVYEYRDDAGKPRFVGGTSEQPEAAYAGDFEKHAGVRNMFEGAHEAPGRAHVVWAAVGGGHCGDVEMKAVREAVCRARAERQQIRELAGAKPYSRHSHLLA